MNLSYQDLKIREFIADGLPAEFQDVRVEVDRLSKDSGINIQAFFKYEDKNLRGDYSFPQTTLDEYDADFLADIVTNFILVEVDWDA